MPKGIYDRNGWKPSLETRLLWSKQRKGKKLSEKQKKQHSKFMKEHPQSLETRQKIALNLPRGKDHWNWKGGISFDKEYRNRHFRLSHRKRKNIKLKIGGFHTEEQWEELKKKYNFTCPCCKKKEPKIKLTRDHIIPLSKSGNDNIKNIQPLCHSCNSIKHTAIKKYEI